MDEGGVESQPSPKITHERFFVSGCDFEDPAERSEAGPDSEGSDVTRE